MLFWLMLLFLLFIFFSSINEKVLKDVELACQSRSLWLSSLSVCLSVCLSLSLSLSLVHAQTRFRRLPEVKRTRGITLCHRCASRGTTGNEHCKGNGLQWCVYIYIYIVALVFHSLYFFFFSSSFSPPPSPPPPFSLSLSLSLSVPPSLLSRPHHPPSLSF